MRPFSPSGVRMVIFILLFFVAPPLLLYGQAGKDGAKTVGSSVNVNEYTTLSADAGSGTSTISVVSSEIGRAHV